MYSLHYCDQVELHTLSVDFAAATRLVRVPMVQPAKGQVVVRRAWAGVNASDINFSAGRCVCSCGVVGCGVDCWH